MHSRRGHRPHRHQFMARQQLLGQRRGRREHRGPQPPTGAGRAAGKFDIQYLYIFVVLFEVML